MTAPRMVQQPLPFFNHAHTHTYTQTHTIFSSFFNPNTMRPFKVTQRQMGLWSWSSGFHPIEGVCSNTWRTHFLRVHVWELPCCLGLGVHRTLCSLEGREGDLSDFYSAPPLNLITRLVPRSEREKQGFSTTCVTRRRQHDPAEHGVRKTQ